MGADLLSFDLAVDLVAKGNYSVVTRNLSTQRAFKIFNSEASHRSSVTNRNRRLTFESEVAAYKIAMADIALRPLIPEFFGVRKVDSIVNTSGDREVFSHFLPDCCYEMELLPGRGTKARGGFSGAVKDSIESHLKRFRSVGINYVADCSVFFLPDGQLKYIDFGVRDILG